MAARLGLRPNETLVVTVTPIAQGVAVPAIVTAAIVAAVSIANHYWQWPREHFWELLVIALPSFVVLAGRSLRWWSHRVAITDQRIMEFAGVRHRYAHSYEYADVCSVQVHQSHADRMLRRGVVVLGVNDETIVLRRVRRPDAFARVVDHVRHPVVPEPPVDVAGAVGAVELSEDLAIDDAPLRWRHLFGDGGAT